MKQSGRVPFIHSFIHSVIHSFIHSFFQPCKPRVQTREPRVQTSFACTNEINSPRVYSREIPLVQTRLRPPAGGGTWEWPPFSHLKIVSHIFLVCLGGVREGSFQQNIQLGLPFGPFSPGRRRVRFAAGNHRSCGVHRAVRAGRRRNQGSLAQRKESSRNPGTLQLKFYGIAKET